MEGFLIQLGYTAGQAAVRAPLYAGLLIAETAILVGGLLYELDRLGVFDGLGAWIGSTPSLPIPRKGSEAAASARPYIHTKAKGGTRHGTDQSKQPY